MCYPDTHYLSGVASYDQLHAFDGSPYLPAVYGTKGLRPADPSHLPQLSLPPGYLNHYVRLHS